MSTIYVPPTVSTNMPDFTPSQIAPENMGKIMRIVSVQQYSMPRDAVLRELVANAADSHREAGFDLNTRPIKVVLPTELSPTLKVCDTGLGLSLAQAIATIGNFGTSTKEATLEVAGAYGIGAKTPYAISTQYEIVTIKDGERVTMLFTIDPNGAPGYYVLAQEATTEPNGLTVSIPIPLESISEWPAVARRVLAWYPAGQITVANYSSKEDAFTKDTHRELHPTLSTENIFVRGGRDILKHRVYGSSARLVIMDDLPYQLPPSLINRLPASIMEQIDHIRVPSKTLSVTPSREQVEDNAENLAVLSDYLQTWRSHITALVLPQGSHHDLSRVGRAVLRQTVPEHLHTLVGIQDTFITERLRQNHGWTLRTETIDSRSLIPITWDTAGNGENTNYLGMEILLPAALTGGILINDGSISTNQLNERLRLYTRSFLPDQTYRDNGIRNCVHRTSAVIIVPPGYDLEDIYGIDHKRVKPSEIKVITIADLIRITNPLRNKPTKASKNTGPGDTVFSLAYYNRDTQRISYSQLKKAQDSDATIVVHNSVETFPDRSGTPIRRDAKLIHISAERRNLDNLQARLAENEIVSLTISEYHAAFYTDDFNKQLVANALWYSQNISTSPSYGWNWEQGGALTALRDDEMLLEVMGDMLDHDLHHLLSLWNNAAQYGEVDRSIKALGKLPKPTIKHLTRTGKLLALSNVARSSGIPLPLDLFKILAPIDHRSRPRKRKSSNTSTNVKETS